MTKLALVNMTDQPNITLDGATVTSDNGVVFTVTLTETQRVTALVWSNTRGGGGTGMFGDGVEVSISTLPGAFRDLVGNLVLESGYGNLLNFQILSRQHVQVQCLNMGLDW